jgi:Domain of unknown function (DUF4440)
MNIFTSEAQKTMTAINQAWLENRPAEMQPYLHPDIIMVLPGFTGKIAGRKNLLDGFVEFCTNARVLEYQESDLQIQVVGNAAFVSFRFDMVYERASYREHSTGRDVWAFERVDEKWLAVWRTMVELQATRQPNN